MTRPKYDKKCLFARIKIQLNNLRVSQYIIKVYLSREE